MNLWTDVLTLEDVHEAARLVNADHPGCQVYVGSNMRLAGKRVRRIERVSLRSSTGTRRPNPGSAEGHRAYDGERAASWTEWGWFLALLFAKDPELRANEYRGLADFHDQTGHRFMDPRTPRQRQVARAVARMA